MKTSPAAVVSIIAHRTAGNGVRQTAKLCNTTTATVQRWSLLVGDGCRRVIDRTMRDLRPHRLELDELHSFVHTRQRHLAIDAHPDHGDVWLYLAEDAVSRAIVHYALGKRTLETTQDFARELRSRTVGRVQIASDGYPAYVTALQSWFGDDVDLAQIVKVYESGRSPKGLPVADRYVSSRRTAILGTPDVCQFGTSHVERVNGTFRARLSKLSRRTLRQAKSLPHLRADVALLVAVYNLVDVHGTTKTTPAVALGVTKHAWSLAELVDAALAEPEPPALPTPVPFRHLVQREAAAPRTVGLSKRARTRTQKALTEKETRVFNEIRRADRRTIAELALLAFPEVTPPDKANSWVRNQLRGLRARKLIEKIAPGTYRALTPVNKPNLDPQPAA